MLAANPFARIKVAKPKVAPVTRLEYSHDDLVDIFGSRLYSEAHRPLGGGGEAVVWLPLIAAYSGARLEEIALLRPQDMVEDPRHGWYFSINDIGEGKQLKTQSSRRNVPVHPVLVQAGLVAYRQAMVGEEWLFPDLVPNVSGQRSGNWSKWWGRYARKELGLDKLKVFHSFRHTFKTACRTASINQEVHEALTGHTPANVGGEYGLHPMSALRDAIDRIHYPGVAVPSPLWPPATPRAAKPKPAIRRVRVTARVKKPARPAKSAGTP